MKKQLTPANEPALLDRHAAPTAKRRSSALRPDRDDREGPHPSRAIRLLCVDDHALVLDGLEAQFAIDGRIHIVGRLPDASKLLDEARRLLPDAVLLDIEMPGPDAFETADRLRQVAPDVRIIVLSAHVRDSYISAAFAAGVCGYFSKSDSIEEIVEGVHEVVASRAGAFRLGSKVSERCGPPPGRGASRSERRRTGTGAKRSPDSAPRSLLESLTARELEILRLIGGGLSRTEIAAQLSRSVKTIDGHQERLMKKLALQTRADLLRFSIREGIALA